MSWSSGRDIGASSDKEKSMLDYHRRQLESIRQINGILGKLADDEDLQDDLKQPGVCLALDHWTGVRRLSTEVYEKKLENDRRVNYVHHKLMLLQSACKEASIKVPLDHMIGRRRELDAHALTTSFGADFCIHYNLTRPLNPENTPGKINSITDQSGKGEEKKDQNEHREKTNLSASEGNVSAVRTPKPFSLWNIISESCSTADWIGIFVDVFKQQFLVLFVTIVIASFLGCADFNHFKS